MNGTTAGWLQVGLLVAALVACYIPLGNYIAKIFTTNKHWKVERAIFKATGIVQMSGLAVQNFMSAAVGLVVAIAMIRGFVRSRTGTLGNFWSDVTHAVIRLLLPLSVIGAIVLMAGGAIDNFANYHVITTL